MTFEENLYKKGDIAGQAHAWGINILKINLHGSTKNPVVGSLMSPTSLVFNPNIYYYRIIEILFYSK